MNCGAWFNVKELDSSLTERERERYIYIEKARETEREKEKLLASEGPRNKQL